MLYSGGASESNALFASNTFGQGVQPCRMVVSSAGGGSLAVLDSTDAVLFSRGAYSPPGTPPATLPAGQELDQASCLPLACTCGCS